MLFYYLDNAIISEHYVTILVIRIVSNRFNQPELVTLSTILSKSLVI